MGPWGNRKSVKVRYLFMLFHFVGTCATTVGREDVTSLDRQIVNYVDEIFNVDKYHVIPGVGIETKDHSSGPPWEERERERERKFANSTDVSSVEDYFYKKWDQYTENHVVAVNLSETSRFLKIDVGKSSFLAGFGMGFLAFALKKLLLPVFIGAQVIKSILIAMFLPSILGSLGKLLGKGLSTVSGFSGSSAGAGGGQTIEDFDFKDTSPYHNDNIDTDFRDDNNMSAHVDTATDTSEAMNRLGYVNNHHIPYATGMSDNYYFRKPIKKTNYKVFHKIPPSSLLLTTYDPFYSPLLSRLDAIFQQLGMGDTKSPDVEKCREKLVCLMYANPTKYAPYSNLISAQLSRELNELRKPSTDNPEILRFFKYMKAAKDGQDSEECLQHTGCSSLSAHQASPAMLTTFNDINKLVQARKLNM